MKAIIKLVLTVALMGMPLTAVADNLIVNGSFEDPHVPFGTWNVFTSIPAWITTFGPGIEVQNHYGSPFEGDQDVELDSHANSGMMQTIPTMPGQTYVLSFAYSPRPNESADSNTIEVLFNGVLLDTVNASGVGLTDLSWSVFAYPVTATGTSSSLEFRAAGISNGYGGHVDAVSFVPTAPVPEPATMLLLSSGLLGLVGLRRKFRK